MAVQDFVGGAWAHPQDTSEAGEEDRRREGVLWRVPRETGPLTNRPPSPSARMGNCHMPRQTCRWLAFGWAGAVAALLAVVLALRWLG